VVAAFIHYCFLARVDPERADEMRVATLFLTRTVRVKYAVRCQLRCLYAAVKGACSVLVSL
jgi:hypothetical protein